MYIRICMSTASLLPLTYHDSSLTSRFFRTTFLRECWNETGAHGSAHYWHVTHHTHTAPHGGWVGGWLVAWIPASVVELSTLWVLFVGECKWCAWNSNNVGAQLLVSLFCVCVFVVGFCLVNPWHWCLKQDLLLRYVFVFDFAIGFGFCFCCAFEFWS